MICTRCYQKPVCPGGCAPANARCAPRCAPGDVRRDVPRERKGPGLKKRKTCQK